MALVGVFSLAIALAAFLFGDNILERAGFIREGTEISRKADLPPPTEKPALSLAARICAKGSLEVTFRFPDDHPVYHAIAGTTVVPVSACDAEAGTFKTNMNPAFIFCCSETGNISNTAVNFKYWYNDVAGYPTSCSVRAKYTGFSNEMPGNITCDRLWVGSSTTKVTISVS
ncbi:MAG: hypothetical protein WDN24_18635 [Sphingomonas sp.]